MSEQIILDSIDYLNWENINNYEIKILKNEEKDLNKIKYWYMIILSKLTKELIYFVKHDSQNGNVVSFKDRIKLTKPKQKNLYCKNFNKFSSKYMKIAESSEYAMYAVSDINENIIKTISKDLYNLINKNSVSNEAIALKQEKIKEEKKVMNKITNDILPKNLILYGPPGTGKTYNTIVEAMRVISFKKLFKDWFLTVYCENKAVDSKDKTLKDYLTHLDKINQEFLKDLKSLFLDIHSQHQRLHNLLLIHHHQQN